MANKNSKGLGRGIDALFSNFEDIEKIDEKTEKVQEIPLDEIRPNPYQPRKTFDDSTLRELADSIMLNGVIQPVILRQSSVKGYEIIAGERRVRASRLAGKTTIPAIVREFDETAMIEVAILENLQREDLTPLEEAEGYQTLMNKLNLTQVDVAQRLGKSRPYIANHLRLLNLPQDVKGMLQEGLISMGQARTLLGLNDESLISELAKRAAEEGITVRHLELLVQQLNNPGDVAKKKNKKKKETKPVYIKESEERLMDKFGTSVQISSKGEKGKIEIEYLSPADLTRILDILQISLDD
ncbi:MAG: ParB/RepB/Spo0J family partition protein [Trichococcus flocculiformis]|jgi:ParB family chromosome partitioning protein|uniref:Chromosome partitioning protein, ParB family n=2 Tax=root TaxID=1 RepID=A0A143YKB3_9LACT|nr:ParB/RepB/Spo0J family partition protein [Trichococcus flocculiformis]MBP6165437.1 ParB/RepB/Spo0J family partition protein [Trichococcus sp.]NCB64996.1 ParB/RepB/Spo0J family partition protein [Bacilli bacterium]MBP6247509.1 ParB/RepB/Spo0J family partition protein [Trichococcus sp.]MBP7129394.1 ParB/RepB/Spo0J family partition protein [Trichococcus sp.]MBP8683421.1 ParB/RepB/Spo0J family partition protein [Trichococcus sp.]